MERLDLSQLGFVVSVLKTEGRPAFESKLFLKIYLNGYPNWIRSRRCLEKESIHGKTQARSFNKGLNDI